MGFFDFISDIFTSQEKKANLSHLKHMMMMAAADGHIDKVETMLIGVASSQYNLSGTDIQKVLNNPADIKPVVPSSHSQKVSHLTDLAGILLIDGKVSPDELQLFYSIGALYNFSRNECDKILKASLAALELAAKKAKEQ